MTEDSQYFSREECPLGCSLPRYFLQNFISSLFPYFAPVSLHSSYFIFPLNVLFLPFTFSFRRMALAYCAILRGFGYEGI